jgi:very-short-patch-repair endonuclease
MSLALRRRRALRQHATDAEQALWRLLRSRQLGGFKFRRQHPAGRFILDFYCAELRLAIELDGGQHYEVEGLRYDEMRTAILRKRGIVVIRFQTDLVLREPVLVLEQIARELGIEVP